jgi:hypothetical protein
MTDQPMVTFFINITGAPLFDVMHTLFILELGSHEIFHVPEYGYFDKFCSTIRWFGYWSSF